MAINASIWKQWPPRLFLDAWMLQEPVSLPALEAGFQPLKRWTALASASFCWTAGGYSSASLGEVWVPFETWVSYFLSQIWLFDTQKRFSVVFNGLKFTILVLLFPLLCRLVSVLDISPPLLFSDWLNPNPTKTHQPNVKRHMWQPIRCWIGWPLTSQRLRATAFRLERLPGRARLNLPGLARSPPRWLGSSAASGEPSVNVRRRSRCSPGHRSERQRQSGYSFTTVSKIHKRSASDPFR